MDSDVKDAAPSRPARRRVAAALGFAAAYTALRIAWASGWRWLYTACDRTAPGDPSTVGSGCGADQVQTLPFRQGWGAVILSLLLVILGIVVVRTGGRVRARCAWAGCAALLALAFPLHLPFEVLGGIIGQPTDWRDLANRSVLVLGALLWGGAALTGPRRPAGAVPTPPAPVPTRVRRQVYAAAAVPLIGWCGPHGLWLLGVPFGIRARELAEIRASLTPAIGGVIVVLPAVGAFLTLGLAARWGQAVPAWVPGLGGRRLPRLAVALPAAAVALLLVVYGVLSAGIAASAVLEGRLTWPQLVDGWAVAGSVLVFIAWGCALGVAVRGYLHSTDPGSTDPGVTDPAEGRPFGAPRPTGAGSG